METLIQKIMQLRLQLDETVRVLVYAPAEPDADFYAEVLAMVDVARQMASKLPPGA